MRTIGLIEAKRRLQELIESGEVVTKHGQPIAILCPARPKPSTVVARIRANPCIRATTGVISAMVREGRR